MIDDEREMLGEGFHSREVAAGSSLSDLWRMIARATPKGLRSENLDRTMQEWCVDAVRPADLCDGEDGA